MNKSSVTFVNNVWQFFRGKLKASQPSDEHDEHITTTNSKELKLVG